MSQLQEQYRLLDIPLDASPAHLKQAYKDLVFVWHPDRFSGNPRLQKKAEEKLKCINLAYQQIRANYRNPSQSVPATATEAQPQQRQSKQARSQKARQRSRQSRSRAHQPDNGGGISLQQIQFIVSHFQFRTTKRGTPSLKIFKSGPFQLEINLTQEWVKLENLCDSLNGFHPILLAIPCKASATFFGEEGKSVIELFKRSQTQDSWL